MRRLSKAIIAAALLAGTPAAAQTQHPTFLSPLAYQQYTSLSTATSLSAVPARAATALICVETAAVRWRDDGTAPTASVGMPLSAGQCMQYFGMLSAIQFIAQSGSPVLDVSFYK